MDLRLKGKRCLVTGGASGIGLATAKMLIDEGCHVVLWDQSGNVREIAARLLAENEVAIPDPFTKNCKVEIKGEVVDVADEARVQQAAKELGERWGILDHLVHCAAVGSRRFGFPFTNLKPEDWVRPMHVNVMGMVHVAHAIAPTMMASKSGSMIFVGSVAGQIGSQTDPPYSASKAATINFAQCLAKDLAPFGVRVNTVCPGMVQTNLNRHVWESWCETVPPEDRITYEQWAQSKIDSVVPLKRWQTSEDIASMIVFLSSDRAAQVTGQTINVDGGYVMHW
ncbi:MAG: SDR family oxidoreductase [Planctomycetes bacterium]|nr:SDR family oxidoreductase [Planctomycetota bacterium]